MFKPVLLSATAAFIVTQACAQDFAAIAQFAQSICGDIPQGELTRSNIQGKVHANAGFLAKIVSAGAETDGDRTEEIYRGIPFEKLPDDIPTEAMCKSALVKIILAKKQVYNTCRLPEFGQEGWNRTESYTDSSGRLGGGHDQRWWCNQVAASFITTRSIGPQNHWQILSSGEEHDRDFLHHDHYKYNCTIEIDWDPRFVAKQDPRCGSHEE